VTKFNRTNDSIGWARFSWNPVTGCNHNCRYCYARDIANRFYPEKFEPTFRPERLSAPSETPTPKHGGGNSRNVFVCSMADLFGAWVPDNWIEEVFAVCRANPQWNYIFLTKNPKRYVGLDFPATAIVGATVTHQAMVERTERAFSMFDAPAKFVSCEPLLGAVEFSKPELFDIFIIGARSRSTGAPGMQPDDDHVLSLIKQAQLAGCGVFVKDNIKGRFDFEQAYPSIKRRLDSNAA
jgi:protein gp37